MDDSRRFDQESDIRFLQIFTAWCRNRIPFVHIDSNFLFPHQKWDFENWVLSFLSVEYKLWLKFLDVVKESILEIEGAAA